MISLKPNTNLVFDQLIFQTLVSATIYDQDADHAHSATDWK